MIKECLEKENIKFLNLTELNKKEYITLLNKFLEKKAKLEGKDKVNKDELTENENVDFYNKLNEERLSKEIYTLKVKTAIEKKFKKLDVSLEDIEKLGGIQFLDKVVSILTYAKTDAKMEELFTQKEEYKDIPEEIKEKIKQLDNYNGIGMLSLSLIYKLNEEMLKGNDYEKSMSILGYSVNGFNDFKFKDKFPNIAQIEKRYYTQITNPNVKHVLVMLKKLYNTLLFRYGAPNKVHLELARDMSNDFSTRNKIKADQIKNFEEKNSISFEIFNNNKDLLSGRERLSNDDILRKRLYDEQKGICMYSGNIISPEIIFTNEVQVDHILPYSKSYDDSYSNKVLVLTDANQNKKNRTPYQWFISEGKDKWETFKKRVNASNVRESKKDKLLFMDNIDRDEFLERSFHATTYASRLALQIFKTLLNVDVDLDENEKIKDKVIPFKGTTTSYLRKFWGLNSLTHNYESDDFKRSESYIIDSLELKCDDKKTDIKSQLIVKAKNKYEDEIEAVIRVNANKKGEYSTIFDENLHAEIKNKLRFEKLRERYIGKYLFASKDKNEINSLEEAKMVYYVEQNEEMLYPMMAFNKAISILKAKVNKKNRSNHLHHALDAILLSVMNRSMQMRLTKFNQLLQQIDNGRIELYGENGEILDRKQVLDYMKEYVKYSNKGIAFEGIENDILELKNKKLRLPLPYDNFKDELKLIIFERLDILKENNEEKMKQYSKILDKYTNEEKSKITSLRPYRVQEVKCKGALHAETILGESKGKITKRVSLDKLDVKKLEKIFDKDGSQKEVYETLKKWFKDSKPSQYPILKNGKIIKKVKLEDDNKEKLIKLGYKRYAEMGQTLAEIRIYKKNNDGKFYFTGIGNYNVQQLKKGNKDFGITIWWGQGANKEYISYNELEQKGYEEYLILRSTEMVYIETKSGNIIANTVGFSSGRFEIRSILGDGIDLIESGVFNKIVGQYAITISTIKNIQKINMNILGEII